MNEIGRDSDGSVIEPNLHDSKLIRIDFGRKQLSMYFQCPGELFFRVVLRNITLMACNHFAEENIILDVVITDGMDVKGDILSSILPLKTEQQKKYVAGIKERLSNNDLKVLEISPSYGGSAIILCESVEYEEVARPFEGL